jgi:hypothetical protein
VKLKFLSNLRVVMLASAAALIAWYPMATVLAASARAFDALQRFIAAAPRSLATLGANTLTSLIPDVYAALDVVSRELVGFIPSVMRDSTTERAAVGQQVRSFVAPAATATDITPGVTPPNDGDQAFGNVAMTITKARRVPFRWQGEESRGINNGGPGVRQMQANQIEQAIRTLCNEMEADLAALFTKASRAYGTANTTPFASDLSDTAQLRKILADNGAPVAGGWNLVIDTSAGAKMRTLTQLTKANEAADVSMLRQGVLLDVHGAAIRESAQVASVATGTGSAYTSNTVGYAVGATSITLITGSGTILAGDVVTFAGDTNKYVVATGVAAPGALVLAAPGLRKALPASAVALSIVAQSARNMGFTRNAIALATRAPALPDDGDMALDRTTIVDARSGLAFELALYAQYRQMQYELSIAWGQQMQKAEHCAILLGQA